MRLWMRAPGLLFAAALAAGCTHSTEPYGPHDVQYADVIDLATELRMAVARDKTTQALILSDAANQVVVSPGTSTALVNGHYVDMGRPARAYQGSLIVPVEGVKRITALLKPRPSSRGGGK